MYHHRQPSIASHRIARTSLALLSLAPPWWCHTFTERIGAPRSAAFLNALPGTSHLLFLSGTIGPRNRLKMKTGGGIVRSDLWNAMRVPCPHLAALARSLFVLPPPSLLSRLWVSCEKASRKEASKGPIKQLPVTTRHRIAQPQTNPIHTSQHQGEGIRWWSV